MLSKTVKEGHWKECSYRRKIVYVYFLVIIITISIIALNAIFNNDEKNSYGLDRYFSIDEELLHNNVEKINIKNLHRYKERDNEYISVFYNIPNNIIEHENILYRSRNASVKAFIDNKEIYSNSPVGSIFKDKYEGSRWNLFPVAKEYAGKVLNLHIKLDYNDERSGVDSFYIGDKAGILLNIIGEKSGSLLLCFLTLFVGLLYITYSIILNFQGERKDYSLLYLAVFAIMAGIWSLIKINIIQLFYHDLKIIQFVKCTMLVLGPIPLYLYMDSIYSIFKNKIIRYISTLDIIYITIIYILLVLERLNYISILITAVISYTLITIILLGNIIKEGINYKIKRERNTEYIIRQIGIVFMSFCILINFNDYFTSHIIDKHYVIRFGFLFFLISFGTGNMYRLIQLSKQGMQTEIVRKLAYYDVLTGLGNRTYYNETLNSLLLVKKKKIAIAVIDLNDLKYVNDNLGHQVGDELIKVSANIINKVFGKIGTVYRVGGDEFTLIIIHENPEKLYKAAVSNFYKEIEKCNCSGNYPFRVSMAHGIAYCEDISKENLNNTEREADINMYKNKEEIKGKFN